MHFVCKSTVKKYSISKLDGNDNGRFEYEKILGEDGLVDPQKLRAISFDPVHNDYLVLGEKVGNAFSDGSKLK